MNYAYREGAFMGKGGVISLVDGEMITLPDLRGLMPPWALIDDGPRGGIKMTLAVDDWMTHREARRSIRREETRPDQPRPTFTEDGYDHLQPLPAAGAPDERRRDRDVRDLLRASRSRRRRNGNGCGTGSPTRRAGRGCRWSR